MDWVGQSDWEWGVWCWDSVGRAVDVPTQRYSTYPHPIPINTKSSPRIPTAYAPLATPHSHHLAQTPTHNTFHSFIPPTSTPAPTLLQPTICDHIHSPPYTIPPQTHPTSSQPDPLPNLNSTHLPHHSHSTNYRTL